MGHSAREQAARSVAACYAIGHSQQLQSNDIDFDGAWSTAAKATHPIQCQGAED